MPDLVRVQNLRISELQDLVHAIAERAELYEMKHSGLTSQFQQAKAAVASQFGRRSPEYKAVSRIRY